MIGTRIAYVLDPQMAVFRQAKLSEGEGFKAIKNEIGSDAIDTLHLDSDHSLFFDDEGLRGSITHYTMLEGHPDPLAGRLLLLADDPDEKQPGLSMEKALARFRCYRAVLDPVFETTNAPTKEGMVFIS